MVELVSRIGRLLSTIFLQGLVWVVSVPTRSQDRLSSSGKISRRNFWINEAKLFKSTNTIESDELQNKHSIEFTGFFIILCIAMLQAFLATCV